MNLLAGGAMNESINSTLLGLPPIPSVAEDLIVMRDIILAEYTNAKFTLRISAAKNAVRLVREAKAKGICVTAEVDTTSFYINR